MPTEIAVCRGTVERVTTVLVTAMVLVAVMFVVVVLSLALAARGHRRRQLDDARAEARHWVERLGGELLVLDGAAVRLGTGAAAGLAEAAERFTAAGVELGAARSPRQCRIAQDTAVEGLHHVRIARSPASTGVPTASATRCSRSTDCSWRAWPKLTPATVFQGWRAPPLGVAQRSNEPLGPFNPGQGDAEGLGQVYSAPLHAGSACRIDAQLGATQEEPVQGRECIGFRIGDKLQNIQQCTRLFLRSGIELKASEIQQCIQCGR